MRRAHKEFYIGIILTGLVLLVISLGTKIVGCSEKINQKKQVDKQVELWRELKIQRARLDSIQRVFIEHFPCDSIEYVEEIISF